MGLPEAAPPAHEAPAVVVEAATSMAGHVPEGVSVCPCAAAEVVDQVVLNEPDGSCTVTV